MSIDMTRDEMIVGLHRVMDGVGGLPLDDIANVEVLIQAGELLVAFETLCTQLYEWELVLTRHQVEELGHLGQQLGASSRYADPLWELVDSK
jgi:hypothetical protein